MKLEVSKFVVGTGVTGELLLTQAVIRQTKTGKNYCDMTFTDGMLNINAKRWDSSQVIEPGVYTVNATVGEYNGVKQLTLTKELIKADVPVTAFAPNRGYNLDTAWFILQTYYDKLATRSIVLQQFVQELLINRKSDWMSCTAAVSQHHVQAGGLVQHTSEVVLLAVAITNAIRRYRVAHIDDGLVIAGAMLHDIGKLETYTINDNAQFERTLNGILNEHIVRGVAILEKSEMAHKYPNVAMLLEHIITSHHGKLEWGSPVEPSFMEAMIVHVADNISAMYDTLDKVYDETPQGNELTDKVFGYNRKFVTPQYIYRTLKLAEYAAGGTNYNLEPIDADEHTDNTDESGWVTE